MVEVVSDGLLNAVRVGMHQTNRVLMASEKGFGPQESATAAFTGKELTDIEQGLGQLSLAVTSTKLAGLHTDAGLAIDSGGQYFNSTDALRQMSNDAVAAYAGAHRSDFFARGGNRASFRVSVIDDLLKGNAILRRAVEQTSDIDSQYAIALRRAEDDLRAMRDGHNNIAQATLRGWSDSQAAVTTSTMAKDLAALDEPTG
jgi:hypothetical protein